MSLQAGGQPGCWGLFLPHPPLQHHPPGAASSLAGSPGPESKAFLSCRSLNASPRAPATRKSPQRRHHPGAKSRRRPPGDCTCPGPHLNWPLARAARLGGEGPRDPFPSGPTWPRQVLPPPLPAQGRGAAADGP